MKRFDFLFKVTSETRELFKKKYGSFDEAIGIFGRYRATILTKERSEFNGGDLIIELANLFAKENIVVITGKGIFTNKEGEIKKCDLFNKDVSEIVSSSHESEKDFSRCLASIPPYAVFLLTSDRSTSQEEEKEFMRNRFEDNKFCVGFLFSKEEINKKCKKLEERKNYFVCENRDYGSCFVKNCPFVIGKIPVADVQKFVNTGFFKLVILKSYKLVPKIMEEFKKGSSI
jgi:hypothetical protein